MRINRRIPAAFARHLRTLDAGYASINRYNRRSASLRYETSAVRCVSTSKGAASRPTHLQTRTLVPRHFHPSEPSPGAVVLQNLAEWNRHGGNASPPTTRTATAQQASDTLQQQQSQGKPPSLTERNRALRKAIDGGDFVCAQQALAVLLDPWNADRDVHPVDTENYDRLLYQWSQQCTKRGRGSSGAHVDLSPMLKLLEAMVVWKRVNARSFNTALVACQRLHALDAGEHVLEMMKQSGRQPKAFAYTTLISCCGRLASKHKGRQDHFTGIAERFFHELMESNTGITVEAVNAIVFVYRAGRGNSAAAVALVERAIREWHLHPDASTIATLLICLLKDKNPLEASRWLEYALKHRVAVDDSIVRSVMDECRCGAHWDKLESLQLQLQERGVAHNDHVLKQILKHSKVRDADSALPSSARPQISISKKEQKKQATMTLKEVIKRIESGESVNLTKTQWTEIFEHGKIDELDTLMHLFVKPNLRGDSTTPRHLLNEMYLRALGSAGQWWRIVQVMEELLEKTPKEVTVECFNAALRGCTRAGRLHEALRVKAHMEQTKVKPNRHSYDALVQCCGSIGAVELAVELFQEMERASIRPTSQDSTAVLKAFATAVHRLIEASQDESTELDVPASDLNMLALHALRFFQDVTSTYPYLEITEGILLHLFRAFLGAAEVFDAVDLRDFELFATDDDHSGHDSRADWILLSNAVQQICRDAPDGAVSPRVINVGIDFFQRRGEPSRAFELFNTMVSRGIPPTSDTIRLLFTSCCSSDEDTQLGLFFLEHLLGDMNDKPESEILQTIASEALRWAGRMTTADDTNDSALVDKVFDKLVASGVLQNDASVYARVMAVFGQDGNLVQAQRVADRMIAETGSLSLAVANRLLQACSVARTPIAALTTLRWMRQHNAPPNLVSYNSVLSAIRRHQERQGHGGGGELTADKDEEEDDDLGSEEEEDDVDNEEEDDVGYEGPQVKKERLSRLETDFNGVLDDLLATVRDEGISPDAKTFENLITIASQRGEVQRILTLYDKIEASAKMQDVSVSALLTQKIILQYLDACSTVATTDSADASTRVHELCSLLTAWHRERDYKVSSPMVLRILQAYDALGQWKDAVAVLKHAADEYGVTPNVEMFHTVMQSCNHASQHKAVEQIFATMQKPSTEPAGKIYPTAACYIEAIYAIEQQGQWIQATQLFMEMQKKCAADDLHPGLMNRIALGRYAEGRKRLN